MKLSKIKLPLSISNSFKVYVTPNPFEKNHHVTSLIQNHWNTLTKKHPENYFDGFIFCLDEIYPTHLVGFYTRYSEYIAQNLLKNIPHYHPVISVGVTGLITHKEHILIGKRSKHVAVYPNLYELAPSGSLDKQFLKRYHIDYVQHLLLELKEETNINSLDIQQIIPFLIVYDPQIHALDICIHLKLQPDFKGCIQHNIKEYSALKWIPIDQLEKEMLISNKQIVPTTADILTAFFNLKTLF